MIEWLKLHWFLITALSTMSVAWGQQQMKVHTLEEAVKEQVVVKQKVEDLKVQTERVDERTKAMLDNQARQERLLEILIQQQRTVIRNQTR